ncbi:pyridoxamine 5'-phosphate oxidase family protein [Pendulispora albinea]|uniref:Pyridoxamine 5'-phosphate oxidase family protein n=1 Tax=Pendulispora albinea TaxID=2741071 RepID=A0ABZ2LTH4_9BACT
MTDSPDSPFNATEQALQERAGVRPKLESLERFIRSYMPDQHREFFAQLPFMLLGAHDASMRPWASILVGRPGFMRSPDPETLRIDALPAEPVRAQLRVGTRVGLLGIQLETRRRNRMNGTVTAVDEAGFVVRVDHSFGNCPQYIQARKHTFVADPSAPSAPSTSSEALGPMLPPEAVALIARADTFFIASAARAAAEVDRAADGLDVSHRGGKPGFVRVEPHETSDRTQLIWPDYRGNFHFNTLGNLLQNPRSGMLFVDFETGDLLSLTGESEVLWDAPELASFARAERFVRFRVSEGLWMPRAVPLRWSAPEQARELAATGSWQDVTCGS